MFKWLVGAVALVAALGGLLWLGNRVLENARDDGRMAERAIWVAKDAAATKARADLEHDLSTRLGQRFDQLSDTLVRLGQADTEVNVRLPKEIAADPRYRNPDCALTPDVLRELNDKRALTQ